MAEIAIAVAIAISVYEICACVTKVFAMQIAHKEREASAMEETEAKKLREDVERLRAEVRDARTALSFKRSV